MEPLRILLLLLGICIWSCTAIVNLTWTAEKGMLILKCKTRQLIWSVQFLSPAGKEIAYCQIPFPSPHCYTTDESYITVNQDTTTNTTILTYKRVSSRLDGQWKCIYGNNVDLDVVNVTIRVKDTSMDDQKDENCSEEFYAWTMLGFTMTMVVFLLYNTVYLLKGRNEGGCIFGAKTFQGECLYVTVSDSNKDGSNDPVSVSKRKLIIIIVLTVIVVVFPGCVGFFTNDCIYKECFIIYGIFKALVMLIFSYNMVTRFVKIYKPEKIEESKGEHAIDKDKDAKEHYKSTELLEDPAKSTKDYVKDYKLTKESTFINIDETSSEPDEPTTETKYQDDEEPNESTHLLEDTAKPTEDSYPDSDHADDAV